MAVFDGKLFCGVLPSGHVHSLEAGKCATYDRELPPGWQHLTAVKAKDRLRIYLNGTKVAESSKLNPKDFPLAAKRALKIGFGQHDYFNGKLKDLSIHKRALSASRNPTLVIGTLTITARSFSGAQFSVSSSLSLMAEC